MNSLHNNIIGTDVAPIILNAIDVLLNFTPRSQRYLIRIDSPVNILLNDIKYLHAYITYFRDEIRVHDINFSPYIHNILNMQYLDDNDCSFTYNSLIDRLLQYGMIQHIRYLQMRQLLPQVDSYSYYYAIGDNNIESMKFLHKTLNVPITKTIYDYAKKRDNDCLRYLVNNKCKVSNYWWSTLFDISYKSSKILLPILCGLNGYYLGTSCRDLYTNGFSYRNVLHMMCTSFSYYCLYRGRIWEMYLENQISI